MRRIGREQLTVDLQILVGQPPLLLDYTGQSCEFRFFICDAAGRPPKAPEGIELRWFARADLRAAPLDAWCSTAADWLAGG